MFSDIDSGFLEKYDKSGPRYTSYPPATSFHTDYKSQDYVEDLKESNIQKPESISLYMHIPFCPKRCSFCGCNTVIGKGKSFMEEYTDTMIQEIENVSAYIDLIRPVSQIHWGGGTPNALPKVLAEKIMNYVAKKFKISSRAEVAIECSPSYLTLDDIDFYKSIGFNRMSIGVQDFHDNVLDIINRDKPKSALNDLFSKLKEVGFTGNNLDLIYGLPGQSVDSYHDNLVKALTISPDRIVTFSYAHVPWVKAHQKDLEKFGLPIAEQKMKMLLDSFHTLTSNGYVPIGMDHFAKETDSLAMAVNNNMLHRNFQGYCTRETTGQVYAFGTSSISQLDNCYTQNNKNVNEYIKLIKDTGFAIERGYRLSDKEKLVRDIITKIMCSGEVDFNRIAIDYAMTGDSLISFLNPDFKNLENYERDGLITFSNNILNVKPKGFLVVRIIAMEFDPYLELGTNKFSRTV
ncbi:MAG: oxygen-independent coproporphyrinogen III oxidase [Candidatus Delongbacteria bacterium]|nr:oxygen-independent coproporphyrinogen III oxidase [Candidatus Delongbacteria bacterium]MBN2834962.1 oxygen-independent coproporphyrinogen III oxidase [Candidatus Delongbacteria bacterium]